MVIFHSFLYIYQRGTCQVDAWWWTLPRVYVHKMLSPIHEPCGKALLWIGRMAFHDFTCFNGHNLGYATYFGQSTSIIFHSSLLRIHGNPLFWCFNSTKIVTDLHPTISNTSHSQFFFVPHRFRVARLSALSPTGLSALSAPGISLRTARWR